MAESSGMPALLTFATPQGAPVMFNHTHITHVTGGGEGRSTIHLTNGRAVEIAMTFEEVMPSIMKQAMNLTIDGIKLAQTLMTEMG